MTLSLKDLGWSNFFLRQCADDADTPGLAPSRVIEVQRDLLAALGADGPLALITGPDDPTSGYAVGDWVLAGPDCRVVRRLERQTLLRRQAAGTDAREQLIAANIDTLFVTSSCNADFNPARLERFLVLAKGAGCFPVLVLTKADLAPDPQHYADRAAALAPNLTVLTLDAHDPEALTRLASWVGPGQTSAFVGSSGVGKTTLVNGLTGTDASTGAIREDDAKGRHTTTARSLRPIIGGGLLIDTPGMRALRLLDASDGIDAVFDDIAGLLEQCRFADCQHDAEPGCAVQAAIAAGTVSPERLARWRKLHREEARNSETVAQSRRRERGFAKVVRAVTRDAQGRKGR